jgi:hypothetical protein
MVGAGHFTRFTKQYTGSVTLPVSNDGARDRLLNRDFPY